MKAKNISPDGATGSLEACTPTTTAPEMAAVDLVEDVPDEVKADLRKYNRTELVVREIIKELGTITAIGSIEQVASAQESLKKAASVEKTVEAKRTQLVKPYNEQVKRVNDYAKALMAPITPAIARVKELILGFHKREEEAAKNRRTEARKLQLGELGYQLRGSANAPDARVPYYVDQEGQTISMAAVEAWENDAWMRLMDQHHEGRLAKANERVRQLQQEKEGAAFFGDDAGAAVIDEQIAEVRQAPAAAAPAYNGAAYAAPRTQGLTKRWVFKVTNPQLVPRAYLEVSEPLIRKAVAGGARSIPGVEIYQEDSISIR